MQVHEIKPLTDPRWADFVEKHPRSSVFHTKPWMEALQRTYGYELIALTTSRPDERLCNAMVFCEVRSVFTGRRLVSLPFSDHCEPLSGGPKELSELLSALDGRLRRDHLRYVEIRPIARINESTKSFHSEFSYSLHQLDLSPDIDSLYRNFHKSSTQRKIQRAEREGLTYEEGASRALLNTFCQLHLDTRQRQGIPPQPKQWFENLIARFGNALKIRVASKDKRPIAAILTIQRRETLLYKYGASDTRFNSLGGTHLLFWRSIQEAKREGLHVFDLGRSNTENHGLATFKERWGAKHSMLYYSRYTTSAESKANYRLDGPDWQSALSKRVLACVPRSLWYGIGELLYKHIG